MMTSLRHNMTVDLLNRETSRRHCGLQIVRN